MKKVTIFLVGTFIFFTPFFVNSESMAASTNAHTIKELKKIKKLAKSGKTLKSGALKLNTPYEKFYQKFGKPIDTFTPKGGAFEDHFTNGLIIYTSGSLNIKTWNLKRVKNDKVKSIVNPYKVNYYHVKKVFGAKKTLSYASGQYSVNYKVGKNTVMFLLGNPHEMPSNTKLYNYSIFHEYSLSNWN